MGERRGDQGNRDQYIWESRARRAMERRLQIEAEIRERVRIEDNERERVKQMIWERKRTN